jgi:hypothetical protein
MSSQMLLVSAEFTWLKKKWRRFRVSLEINKTLLTTITCQQCLDFIGIQWTSYKESKTKTLKLLLKRLKLYNWALISNLTLLRKQCHLVWEEVPLDCWIHKQIVQIKHWFLRWQEDLILTRQDLYSLTNYSKYYH